ncbi:MAG: kelch repeat-containing protein, partial [candidate division WOR-3 bacterium]
MRYLTLIFLILPLILFSWRIPTRTPFPQQSGTAMTFGCFFPAMTPPPPLQDYGKLYAIFPRWGGYLNRFCSWDCSQNVYPGVWDTSLPQLPTTTGYPGDGVSLCYFADWAAWESFIFCIPGLAPPSNPRNEFWVYHIEGRTWYRLPDVPNPSTTIGYGSDMCLGRIVHNIYPDRPALEIYVLKGTCDPNLINNEFYVFYFPLGIPVVQKLQLIGNYREGVWKRLADFEHGPNAQMTFVPQETAIYAFRGRAGGDDIVFRYSIRNNEWTRMP